MPLTEHKLINYLHKMVHDHPNTIEAEIAHWLFNWFEPLEVLGDFIQRGYKSEKVLGMNYFACTHAFFDKHYRQISKIYYETEVSIPSRVDVKHWLTRHAYWYVASQIALSASYS